MSAYNFEDIIREAPPQTIANERVYGASPDGCVSLYQNNSGPASDFDKALKRYKKAYFERKKLEVTMKEISSECEAAKDEMVKIVGYENYENDECKLTHTKRAGNVDWRKLQAANPHIDVDDYRSKESRYWTLKLKVTA
jgi:hypothetical protein